MATVTVVIAQMYDEDGTSVRLEVDYADATDPNNPDLIAVRCVNGLGRPVIATIQRTDRTPWFEVTVPAGQTRSKNPGGPIRRLNDIPRMGLRA